MRYEPEVPAELSSVPELLQYVVGEFRRIAVGLAGTVENPLQELHVAPTKIRTGMIVLADGTNWNPGAGQGVYAYYNGAWNKLG